MGGNSDSNPTITQGGACPGNSPTYPTFHGPQTSQKYDCLAGNTVIKE